MDGQFAQPRGHWAELVARIGASDVKTTGVVISADRTVDFQYVIAAMDAAWGAGVKDIGLAAN